jgi:acyl-CoA thioesterase
MSAIDDLRALRNAAGVEPLGPGRYAVDLSEYYTAVDHPNGGYLQCVLGNAALAAASEQGAHHLHVTAITTNFIGAPALGSAELRTEVRRVGRGVSFVHVTLVQDDQVTTESLVTLGTLHEDSEARYMDATPPHLAPLGQCPESLDSDEVNIRRVVDLRVDPSSERWWEGELSERGEVSGWMRLNDGDAAWSAWSLLFASDAIPPATFPLGSTGWVPTLQLTSYVRRIPTSEWLRFRQWCIVIADGLVDERCELFDDRDELVASASQIAMVRFPGHH